MSGRTKGEMEGPTDQDFVDRMRLERAERKKTRSSRKRQNASSDELSKLFDETINLCDAPYDGIAGSLPEWVPVPVQREFSNRRSMLLSNYGLLELQGWLESYRQAWFNTNYTLKSCGCGIYPYQIEDDLDFFCHLRFCVSRGPGDGLKALAGDDAVLGAERRKQLKRFARNSAIERKEERGQEHDSWRAEAVRLTKKNSRLASNKSELARRIKENLDLNESVQTIRKRL